METLASAMRRDNRRFKAPSSSTTSSSAGRVPLVMAFLSCLAWLYVAGRLWQDAQTRAILSGLLEKSSGNLPKAVSVDDKLRNLGCTEIGRKIAEAEMDLTKAKSEGLKGSQRHFCNVYCQSLELMHLVVNKSMTIQESHEEAAEELPSKVKFFFSAAIEAWDAEFYVKVDDNINLDLGSNNGMNLNGGNLEMQRRK
ncbi:hypothetical protein ACQ4PT_009024 [Festuca glaucescens]